MFGYKINSKTNKVFPIDYCNLNVQDAYNLGSMGELITIRML